MTRPLKLMNHTSEGDWPKDHWYAVSESRKVRRNPLGVRRLGRDLVLWRDGDGRVRAHDARCPHRGASLSLGRVVNGRLECPYHGLQFAPEGPCTRIPCDGRTSAIRPELNLRSYPTAEAHGFVWLWWGESRDDLPPVPWFPELPRDGTPSVTGQLEWNMHPLRAIEGNLDMHHAPFAHRRWLGWMGTRIDPMEAWVEDDVVHSRGRLRRDDGSAWDGKQGYPFEISARLPGVIRLKFGGLQGVVMITPMETDRCWIAFRYMVPIPIIGWVLAWLGVVSELTLVQPDDERMLLSSTPRTPDVRDYVLVRADAPIALWHRLWRQELERQMPLGRRTSEVRHNEH